MSKYKASQPDPQSGKVATAVHFEGEDGTQVVGIGNIKVFIFQEDGAWVAHGVEIDYVAQGATLEAAQKSFEAGLRKTIHYHLERFGTIKAILKFAPEEISNSIYKGDHNVYLYSHRFLHEIVSSEDQARIVEMMPYLGIDYLTERAA